MIEHKSTVVNWIESHFNSHIFNHDTSGWLHVVVSDGDDEAVDSFVDSVDDGLSKDDGLVGVTGSVSDPVLLRLDAWGVDSELLCSVVISGGGFHLRRVVTVSELCEAEASHDV